MVGKADSTRSALRGRSRVSDNIRRNENARTSTSSCSGCQNKLDAIEKRLQNIRKQFEKELANMKQKVRGLEDEVKQMKEMAPVVEGCRQDTRSLRNELHKLQQHPPGNVQELTTNRNKTIIKDVQRSIQITIQLYIKENIYRELKFVEYDHLTPIYQMLIKRPEHKIPEGVNEEEYKRLVIGCIKKAFCNLRHNSQTLIRRNYIGKYQKKSLVKIIQNKISQMQNNKF